MTSTVEDMILSNLKSDAQTRSSEENHRHPNVTPLSYPDHDHSTPGVPRYSGAAKSQLAYDTYSQTISNSRNIPLRTLQASTSPSKNLTDAQLLKLMVKDRLHKQNPPQPPPPSPPLSENSTSAPSDEPLNTGYESDVEEIANVEPRAEDDGESDDGSSVDGDEDDDDGDGEGHVHTHKNGDPDRQRQCANTAYREAMIRDGETRYRERQADEDDAA
ncbi:hypothetical protein HK097_009472 [Rhizophlyctis rosea]|uniref:Uncharacterized protein n=1 Tax=Rhizophlyctis rosea TaxID=64517 RepID=A0AAD5X129_9FUNG|nr:hypothetical protein HK097_009472 [Rhizophlyctis rosea]